MVRLVHGLTGTVPGYPVIRRTCSRWYGVAAFTVAASFAGCAEGQASDQQPYAADFRAARDSSTSDFERQVLEDDRISWAEYEEGVNRYVDCMSGLGYALGAIEQYGRFIYETRKALDPEDDGRCRDGTIEHIEPLYLAVAGNPGNAPMSDAIVECLNRRGLVDDDYTGDDLEREERGDALSFDAGSEAAARCYALPAEG